MVDFPQEEWPRLLTLTPKNYKASILHVTSCASDFSLSNKVFGNQKCLGQLPSLKMRKRPHGDPLDSGIVQL